VGQEYIALKKIAQLFGGKDAALVKDQILALEQSSMIPKSTRTQMGALFGRSWKYDDLAAIGAQVGFFKKFDRPMALSVFTTKGGVLKSTLALNLARLAALHGMKVCVVGLDIQGDITNALGFEADVDESSDLQGVLARLGQTKGLSELFSRSTTLESLIVPTDLKNLQLIPETPELAALNDTLMNVNRREYWLKEQVIDPLKRYYDLVIMDCSPNWNRLTTNALVACDALVSPLECKINNFRNFKVFRGFLTEFKRDMRLEFETVFVPTRYSLNRKLSLDIRDWYQQNIEGCTSVGIKEALLGEEAVAMHRSIIEQDPYNAMSMEVMALFKEVHDRLCQVRPRTTVQSHSHFEENSAWR